MRIFDQIPRVRWRRVAMGLAALTLGFGATGAAPKSALARPDDYKVNAREGCRQSVSGAYIKAYDEREKARTLAKSLRELLKDTEAALSAATSRESTLKSQAAGKAFDIEHATELDTASTKVKTYSAQKADLLAQLSRAAVDEKTTIEKEKSLLAVVTKAFTMTRMGDQKDGGYPIRLDYKSPCPKYRALCPLPAAEAEIVRTIPLESGADEPCRRYASLSKLR